MPSIRIAQAAVGLALALTRPVSAFWRMPCPGRLVLERIDPIVSPYEVSGHVHTVSGGSGFGFNTTYEQQRASACSSCPIKDDLSAYWTPKLYYMAEDGHFEDVPQAGEGNGATGGMTVYYEQRGPDLKNLLAFPEGFRMLAGDPWQRNDTGLKAAPGKAVSFVCLDYSGATKHPQTGNMPDYNCPDGLRAQVYFPSCWNGVDMDPPDHHSHMAYPIGEYDNGTISIFYEIIYQTNLFAERWYDASGKHPFVFAQGDRTGYGFHGDFVNGWDVEILKNATRDCTNDSGSLSDCKYFDDLFSNEECQACKIPPMINETVTGNLTKLAGCNTPTEGPEYAPPQKCSLTPIGTAQEYFTNVVSSLGWEYQGCANDSVVTRTLQGANTASNSMTIETCIDFCKGKGYSLAGLEYASQCYCDNDYKSDHAGSRAPQPDILGDCWQPCAGNSAQVCGGAGALSVYRNCEGGACDNVLFHVNGSTTAPAERKRHLHSSRHNHGHAKL
ncbi:hypothetical protein LTR86_005927 [Recurvomyces mirabilis]|nr:hypothetical protein LTR86_005927 [Recurvomyces mirabilis]